MYSLLNTNTFFFAFIFPRHQYTYVFNFRANGQDSSANQHLHKHKRKVGFQLCSLRSWWWSRFKCPTYSCPLGRNAKYSQISNDHSRRWLTPWRCHIGQPSTGRSVLWKNTLYVWGFFTFISFSKVDLICQTWQSSRPSSTTTLTSLSSLWQIEDTMPILEEFLLVQCLPRRISCGRRAHASRASRWSIRVNFKKMH